MAKNPVASIGQFRVATDLRTPGVGRIVTSQAWDY